jgi:hypothetical protein
MIFDYYDQYNSYPSSQAKVHSMHFISLYFYFPVLVAQQCLHSKSFIIIEPVGYSEVAEDGPLQTLQPNLRIAEDYVIGIVGHALLLLLQVEHVLVGQTDYQARSICIDVRGNG